uniref:Uncharacterized protein n=1 Tax=Rhodnius prolixus TaxID=13249 RepID=T1HPH0_RHOPR
MVLNTTLNRCTICRREQIECQLRADIRKKPLPKQQTINISIM